MVWQPTGTTGGTEQGDIRVGSHRPSMDMNTLLVKPGLGTVKPTQFNNPPPDHCFGYNPPKDPEGAREGKATVIEPIVCTAVDGNQCI